MSKLGPCIPVVLAILLCVPARTASRAQADLVRISPEEEARAKTVICEFVKRLQGLGTIPAVSLGPLDLKVSPMPRGPMLAGPETIQVDGAVMASLRRSDIALVRFNLMNLAARPVGPKVSKADVVAIALRHRQGLAPQALLAQLGAPAVSPWEPKEPNSDFPPGWVVFWPRVVDGYAFPNDWIQVATLWDGQFEGFSWSFESVPPPTTVVKISLEEAKKLGHHGAEKIIGRFSYRFTGHRLQEVLRAEVQIVNVNFCHTWPNQDEHRFAYPSKETRLAWVVTFRSKDVRHLGIVNPQKEINVHIDAATGELLGGDYTT